MLKKSHKIQGSDEELLLRYFKTKSAELRTRYDRTIVEIEKVFPRPKIYYGVYEEMFLVENVKKLSDFIGVTANLSYRENKFNISEKKATVSDETRRKVAEYFHEVYEFCAERFPVTRTLWDGYRLCCGPATLEEPTS